MGGFRPSAGERLVALSRALPSESVSSRSIFNRPLSHPIGRTSRFCVGTVHTLSAKAINRASRAPQTWVECGPHPALVRNGMWRNPIETHVCGRLSGFGGGSGRATGGGCVTERTRFTPAVNGGILSLIKDRPRELPNRIDKREQQKEREVHRLRDYYAKHAEDGKRRRLEQRNLERSGTMKPVSASTNRSESAATHHHDRIPSKPLKARFFSFERW